MLYVVFTIVVAGIVALAVLEAATDRPIYGVDTGTTDASGGDIELQVEFPKVTRAQLSSPLKVTIRSARFGDSVTVTVSSDYLELFSVDEVSPQPTSATRTDSFVQFTFDAPQADVLTIEWDLAARPIGFFASDPGRVTVLDSQQQPVVTAAFRTLMRP